MTKITTLKEQLGGMTVECALLCIIQKGAGDKCFFWGGRMWTPKEAKSGLEDCILQMNCGQMGVVRFYGGPPGKGSWYDGTVLTMLCDLFLFDENTQGWSTSEKISA